MIIKVCGMRKPENIEEISALGIDWMGFIFYPKSPRFVPESQLTAIHSSCSKVAVFVNSTTDEMLSIASGYGFEFIQLHGHETPDTCFTLQKRGFRIIKAFSVEEPADFKQTIGYEPYVDYFLFDTKCKGYGGSGQQFDWSILKHYTGTTPFLLSGGITPESAKSIKSFRHDSFAGIDLNSGFEIAPALKNRDVLKTFIQTIRK